MNLLQDILDEWVQIPNHHKVLICAVLCVILATIAIALETPILVPFIILTGISALLYCLVIIVSEDRGINGKD